MNGNEEQKNTKTGFFSRIKRFIDQKLDAYEEKQARRDVIFTETITPQAKPEPKTLVRGGIDMQLLLAVVALLILGATMSFSASYVFAEQRYGDSFYFFVRYIIYAVISVVAVAAMMIFLKSTRLLKIGAFVLYGFSIILLLLVLVMGRDGGGAQRWLQLGPITIQPSEIAKTATVMMLALYMSHYEKEIKSVHKFGGSVRHGVLMPGLIIGLICGLVMLEKHISGVMIIGLIGLAVMFIGGTHKKWIFLILGSLAAVALLLILVSSYAQARVDTWINIDKVDPRGET
ncbi:MAG: FtsW/RodA/SpoVE family cell cycle protein [Clostridia bacterium]|nr:FtsW/RodA/SpoVE family cell cycle protein [Clostridia bacterium]